jgi:serine/threonine-protein kinase
MVQPDGTVKVMDFGIARAGNSMMTQTGSVLGTAQYLSPEQAQGTPLTATSDLYSLGIVLYEAATGRLPFDADTPVAVALKQVNEQAIPPHVANPDVDPNLDAVIVKAMQKKTTERYVSADDLRKDLRAVAQGRPVVAAGYAGMVAGGASAGMTSRVDENTLLPRVDKTAVMPRVSGSEGGGAGKRPAPRAVPNRRPVWPWIVLAVLLVVAGLGVAWSAGVLGSQSTPVPDVRSMTRANAQIALQDAGFTVGSVKENFSDSVKTGAVVSQSTEPNATAKKGSAVDLVLSKGPELIPVPNVIGMLEADAFKAAETAGFSPQALPSQFNSAVPANTVYEQTPAGDEKAVKGSIISYVVSRGTEPFFVPDVSGKKKDGRGHR